MKASRAPGPISYGAQKQKQQQQQQQQQQQSASRPAVKKSGAGAGDRLTKFLDLDDIPDLDNDWQAQPLQTHTKPPILLSPKRIVVDRDRETESDRETPSVSYHIKSVHRDYNQVVEGKVAAAAPAAVVPRHSLPALPASRRDNDDEDYDQQQRGGRVSGRQPYSADYYRASSPGVTSHRMGHGHATAPEQLNSRRVDEDWNDDDDIEEDIQVHHTHGQHTVNHRAYEKSADEISDEEDEYLLDDEPPQLYSPSKKKAPIVISKNQVASKRVTIDKNESKVKDKASNVVHERVQLNPPPPLPCDVKKEASPVKMSSEDMLHFAKQPREVQFKPYTLNQYKMIRPKEYVEISNMKPDLNTDELIAKRKNVDRIKQFSKQLRHFNQEVLTQQPKKPSSIEENDLNVAKSKQESNRQRALEFAKNVPKPKVHQINQGPRISNSAGSNGTSLHGGLYMDDEAIDAAKLLELENKHSQNKAKMDAIKKSLVLNH